MSWVIACFPGHQYVVLELREFLAQAGAFTSALAQEIQLRPAHFSVPLDNYFLNTGGVRQEGALYADAIAGHATHGEVFIVAAIACPDHGPTELLDALVVAFFDAQEHFDHIARADLGHIFIDWRFYRFKQVFLRLYSSTDDKIFVC